MGKRNKHRIREESRRMQCLKTGPKTIGDKLDILLYDYPRYFSDLQIRWAVHSLLLASDLPELSYQAVRKRFDTALKNHQNNEYVLRQIDDLAHSVLGEETFLPRIGIVDGLCGGSYFQIAPVKFIAYPDIDSWNNEVMLKGIGISVEEDDIGCYLAPFLLKHFDEELDANKNRSECSFDWYGHNYFTLNSVRNMLENIRETINTMSSGNENEFTNMIREDSNIAPDEIIIDFYERFIYRMEYMVRVAAEYGYPLICFMGI